MKIINKTTDEEINVSTTLYELDDLAFPFRLIIRDEDVGENVVIVNCPTRELADAKFVEATALVD